MNTKRRVLSTGLTFVAALLLAASGNQVQIQKLTHRPLVEIQLHLTIY
ncbi:Uncharacterised protein [Streptococcus pneumoniae]|nr:Uncharacterised protein [Streptococcus pneumoniae]